MMLAELSFLSRTVMAAALAIVIWPISTAYPFVITLDGHDGLRVETAAALYAGSGSRLRKVVEVGMHTPGGGVIEDLGNPAIASHGAVVFAAQVRTGSKADWKIFRTGLDADSRLEAALDDASVSDQCRAVLQVDPGVAAASDGSLAFVANDQARRATLFRITDGRLECALRSGEKTEQGNTIANLGFGSAQLSDDGSVVLRATVTVPDQADPRRQHRNVILLAALGHRATELEPEPEGTKGPESYAAQFGSPAIASVEGQSVVAFTGHGTAGTALFVGPPGHISRIVATGATTSDGPLTYLSDGKPSLARDGSVAIEAASRAHSMILGIRAGESFVVANEGDSAGHTHNISGLADPVGINSERVFSEAADESEHNGVYSFPFSPGSPNRSSAPSLLSGAIEVFPESLAVDTVGRFAFLSFPTSNRRTPGTVTNVGSHEGESL